MTIARDDRRDCADLISRLERATCHDPSLDRAIADVVFDIEWKPYRQRARKLWGFKRGTDDTIFYGEDSVPHYTHSLEAALSLLPEHISYELTQSAVPPPRLSRCRLWDWRRGPLMSDPDNEWKAEGNQPLAVNVCIAALKARANPPDFEKQVPQSPVNK